MPFPWNIPPIPDTEEFRANRSLPDYVAKFDGDVKTYFDWHSSFLANVHQMSITVPEKALTMRSCMDRQCYPLKTVIQTLSRTNRAVGYAEAIDLLEEMFGGSDRLNNKIYQDIKRMNAVQDSRGLVYLLGIVRSVQSDAEERGQVYDSSSHAELFKLILRKLPTTIHYQYKREARAAYGKLERPLSFMVDFLASQLSLMQGDDDDDDPVQAKGARRGQKGALAAVSGDAQRGEPYPGLPFLLPPQDGILLVTEPEPPEVVPQACFLCIRAHLLEDCEIFKGMSVRTRRSYAEAGHVCYNCLKLGHMANKCDLLPACNQCAAAHHPLLHRPPTKKTKQKVAAQGSPPQDAVATVERGCCQPGGRSHWWFDWLESTLCEPSDHSHSCPIK